MALTCVLMVQAFLTIRETMKKHKDDVKNNATPTEMLNRATKKFESKTWADIRIGDIIKVSRGEFIPADLIFMSAAPEKYNYCHLNTKSLDGETDNKLRKALDSPWKNLSHLQEGGKEVSHEEWEAALIEFALSKMTKSTITCEQPNNKTNDFVGRFNPGSASADSGMTS